MGKMVDVCNFPAEYRPKAGHVCVQCAYMAGDWFMKSVLSRLFAAVCLLAVALTPAAAADSQSLPSKVIVPGRLGLSKHATALLGRAVVTEQGLSAGTIADVLLDFPSSEITGVVLRLTNGTEVVTLCSSFTCVRDDRIAVEALAPSDRDLRSAASVRQSVGRDLAAASGGRVARVTDFVLDVRAGKIIYVVTETPAAKGKVDTRLVPAAVVGWEPGCQHLRLKATTADYLAGPVLHRRFPVEMFTGTVAAQVYGHYGLGSQVSGGTGGGSDPGDLRLTRAILASLPHSDRARQTDVMAVTQNGRVVLEGVVESRDQERKIVAAAERLAGAGNVRNELRLAQEIRSPQ